MSTAAEIEIQIQEFARNRWPKLTAPANAWLARLTRLALDLMEREFIREEIEVARMIYEGSPAPSKGNAP